MLVNNMGDVYLIVSFQWSLLTNLTLFTAQGFPNHLSFVWHSQVFTIKSPWRSPNHHEMECSCATFYHHKLVHRQVQASTWIPWAQTYYTHCTLCMLWLKAWRQYTCQCVIIEVTVVCVIVEGSQLCTWAKQPLVTPLKLQPFLWLCQPFCC